MHTPYKKSERNDTGESILLGYSPINLPLGQTSPYKQLFLNFLGILFDKSVNKHKIVYKGILTGGKTNGRQTTDIDGC
jgi:hypothetical protein